MFLDRDGTINRDVPYCSRPEDMELLPGVARGIAHLNQHFKVVVVTNQSGVARGYFTEEMLGHIHRQMLRDLAREGARVDAIYYCPHHPDEGCGCRKPRPGLILSAAEELDIDLPNSYFMGDQLQGMAAAREAGCRGVLIDDLFYIKRNLPREASPDYIAPDFRTGALWIVAHARSHGLEAAPGQASQAG
ncbi:MAG: HAD family hydrolase [Dehalococcoidia bacterium]|nr:HAD family hydrolase [Dehalococcoidia bacterium]